MELTRRKFLQTAVLSAAGAAAGLSLANLGLGPFVLRKVEAEQDTANWALQVTNLSGDTVSFAYDRLWEMPAATVDAELDCDNALVALGPWSGVSLSDLLQQAGLDSAVAWVNFRAQDGYAVSIPLSEALNQNVIIAYETDGSPLPEVLRLVLPGENGDNWINKITSITMSAAIAGVGQSGSTPTNSTGPTSTQASTTPKPSTAGSSSPVAVPYGIAAAATVALMAAGYVAWFRRKSE